jgi:peptidoglycan/LPS O-acetylase OafA/YrhL
MVFVFHVNLLDVGWMGVWLFFVISGFAVTSSLLGSVAESSWQQIRNFYARRALRIWPLYFSYIVLIYVGLFPWSKNPSFGNLPYLASFTYNFRMAFTVSGDDIGWYLGHLWTLSVEEQFYLLLPVALVFLSRRNLELLLMAIIILCPLARWRLGIFYQMDGVYFFGPDHFDAFAVGVLIALYRPVFENQYKYARPAMFVAASAFVLYCAVYLIVGVAMHGISPEAAKNIIRVRIVGQGREIFLYIMMYVVSGALIIRVLTKKPSLFFRVAQNKYVQGVGIISYGVYMFHPAVLHVIYTILGWDTPHKAVIARLIVLTLAFPIVLCAASLSFRYLEQPFLKLRKKLASRPVPPNSVGWSDLGSKLINSLGTTMRS